MKIEDNRIINDEIEFAVGGIYINDENKIRQLIRNDRYNDKYLFLNVENGYVITCEKTKEEMIDYIKHYEYRYYPNCKLVIE